MSFVLTIGKNAKPGFLHGPNPGFRVWKTAGLPRFITLLIHYIKYMCHEGIAILLACSKCSVSLSYHKVELNFTFIFICISHFNSLLLLDGGIPCGFCCCILPSNCISLQTLTYQMDWSNERTNIYFGEVVGNTVKAVVIYSILLAACIYIVKMNVSQMKI